MKKSYIVFGVFTAFTQAVFAVLLFLEKFGVLHFDGQIAGIAMAVVPAVGVALTKSCDEKYEEIQKLFYVLFGCYCLVLVLDILGILSSGTANVIAGTAMTIGSLTLLWLYNYGKKKSNTFDGFREIRKEIILFTLILLGRNIFAVFAYSDEYIAIFSNLLALVQAAGLMFVGAAQYWGGKNMHGEASCRNRCRGSLERGGGSSCLASYGKPIISRCGLQCMTLIFGKLSCGICSR